MAERIAWVTKIADALEAIQPQIGALESLDTGKPVALATAVDANRSVQNFRFFAKSVTPLPPCQRHLASCTISVDEAYCVILMYLATHHRASPPCQRYLASTTQSISVDGTYCVACDVSLLTVHGELPSLSECWRHHLVSHSSPTCIRTPSHTRTGTHLSFVFTRTRVGLYRRCRRGRLKTESRSTRCSTQRLGSSVSSHRGTYPCVRG